MKAYHSLVVFMFIVACAALSSMHSYRSAEREMVADMSQALMQTLAEKSEMTIPGHYSDLSQPSSDNGFARKVYCLLCNEW